MRISQQDLICKISDFNVLMQSRGLKSRLQYDKNSSGGYKLLLGSVEQFTYGTWQSVVCDGTLQECMYAAQAIYLSFAFEFNIF